MLKMSSGKDLLNVIFVHHIGRLYIETATEPERSEVSALMEPESII